eukprot:6185414-Pleurochrysis_carterae.AAC.1
MPCRTRYLRKSDAAVDELGRRLPPPAAAPVGGERPGRAACDGARTRVWFWLARQQGPKLAPPPRPPQNRQGAARAAGKMNAVSRKMSTLCFQRISPGCFGFSELCPYVHLDCLLTSSEDFKRIWWAFRVRCALRACGLFVRSCAWREGGIGRPGVSQFGGLGVYDGGWDTACIQPRRAVRVHDVVRVLMRVALCLAMWVASVLPAGLTPAFS